MTAPQRPAEPTAAGQDAELMVELDDIVLQIAHASYQDGLNVGWWSGFHAAAALWLLAILIGGGAWWGWAW